jgi:hypothetical protein
MASVYIVIHEPSLVATVDRLAAKEAKLSDFWRFGEFPDLMKIRGDCHPHCKRL